MTSDWKAALQALNDSGAVPHDDSPEPNPESNPSQSTPQKADSLRVLLDKKGRKGKAATIIEGFSGSDAEVAGIARTLKQSLAIGGSSRGGEILLQGDCRRKAAEILQNLGYKVKTL